MVARLEAAELGSRLLLRTRSFPAGLAACAAVALGGCDAGQDFYEYRPPPPHNPLPVPPSRDPVFSLVFVAPLETGIGGEIMLSAAATSPDGSVSYRWEGKGGVIKKPTAPETTFTCTAPGMHTVVVHASSRGGMSTMSVPVTCTAKGDH